MTDEATAEAPEPVRFEDLEISPLVREGLDALGYEVATPVQAAAFAPAAAGKDLTVQSKTGTGKTTAFGLPLIERVSGERDGRPEALILCPTRELALQVASELETLGGPKGARVVAIYGGAPINPQLRALEEGAEVIAGTPGRVLDHIRRGTLKLDRVRMMVLDEADEMLSMGFWDEVTAILDRLPKERQTLLFSATLPDEIRRTAEGYMKDPENLNISQDELTVEGITNIAYEVDPRFPRPRNLLYVLEVERPESAIIFCNTRDDTAVVSAFLRRQGHHALALSGDLRQKDREKIMARMKSGELKYLVATDIAARGIDISELGHVVNYSLPDFTEVYVHRVGRTGRAGRTGTAISLISGRDEMTYTQLERQFSVNFEKRTLPDIKEIQKSQAERVGRELYEECREVEVSAFTSLADHLKEQPQGVHVIAFLLKQYFSALEAERAGESEDEGDRSAAPSRGPRERAPRSRGDDRRRDARRSERGPARSGEDRHRGPRSGARDAGPRRPRLEGPVRRLFVNRGSNDGFGADEVRALIEDVHGGPVEFGTVQVRRTHSFLELRPDAAERVVAGAASHAGSEDKPLSIEVAKSRAGA